MEEEKLMQALLERAEDSNLDDGAMGIQTDDEYLF
jgi:hypothetical protein